MERILTNYNQQSCCFGFNARLLNFYSIFLGLMRKEYLIHPATHKIGVHSFQEGFLYPPLLNLPCPGLSLNMLCRLSLKYGGISETARNHARYKGFHSASCQFLFLRFPVWSYIKHTAKGGVRQGENSMSNEQIAISREQWGKSLSRRTQRSQRKKKINIFPLCA